MKTKGRSFSGETIILDFQDFEDCTFNTCVLVIHGFGPVGLVGCRFIDCKWSFSGPAANAVSFMAALYRQGGEARQLIERTFENIRKDTTPRLGQE